MSQEIITATITAIGVVLAAVLPPMLKKRPAAGAPQQPSTILQPWRWLTLVSFIVALGTLFLVLLHHPIARSSPSSIRFDDGTQICWGALTVRPHDARPDLREISTTYPTPFTSPPTVTLAMHPKAVEAQRGVTWTEVKRVNSSTSFAGTLIAFHPEKADDRDFATNDVTVDYIAIGQ